MNADVRWAHGALNGQHRPSFRPGVDSLGCTDTHMNVRIKSIQAPIVTDGLIDYEYNEKPNYRK